MAFHHQLFRVALSVLLFPLSINRNGALAWNYQENGADWTQLGLCNGLGSHTAQSPIDLPIQAPVESATNLYLKYPKLSSPVQLYNNEKSMAMTMPESYTAGFGVGENFGVLSGDNADVYRLWQVSFHAPSEHTLNGIRYPLEMQMMHQRVNGEADLAVVVVLFEAAPDATNNFLDVVLAEGLPQNAWDEVMINDNSATGADDATISHLELNFGAVAGGSGYFSYEGSLTVPPCETGVKYYIRQQPIAADPTAHIEPFASALSNLCPPNGNYRAISAASSAYSSVKMISSIDVILSPDSKARPHPLQVNPAAVSAAMDRYYANVLQNAEDISVLGVDDSMALRDAKTQYHLAMMDNQAASAAKLAAEMQLTEASNNYNNAAGYVEQIDFKWKLIAANDAMAAATTAMGAANHALAEVIHTSGKIYIEEKGLSPTYEVSTASTVATESDPDLVLQYSPLVSLPRGSDASPFSPSADSVAESSVRVGSGVVGSGTPLQNGMKIAPNLKQPDGAAGQVPIPSLVRRTTTTAAPTTTPPPMQMVLKLPIQFGSIVDMPAFQTELSETVATSMGIDPARVEVSEVRPAIMYPSADGTSTEAAPPPAVAASSPASASVAASPAAAVFMHWRSTGHEAPRRQRQRQERRHQPGLLRRLMR